MFVSLCDRSFQGLAGSTGRLPRQPSPVRVAQLTPPPVCCRYQLTSAGQFEDDWTVAGNAHPGPMEVSTAAAAAA